MRNIFINKTLKWISINFFSSRLNTLLSLLSLLFIYYISVEFINFLLSADWEVVKVNRRLLLLGRLPLEDTWRAWPIFWIICFTLFSSIGAWGSPKKIELTLMFLAIILPSLIFLTLPNLHLFIITLVISILSYFLFKKLLRPSGYLKISRQFLIILWILIIPMIFLMLIIGGGPKPN